MGIKHLILFVTSRCDSKCVMCFNSNLNIGRESELTLSEYEKIASNLKSHLQSLMISGGEPSLREDLPKICQIFYDRCHVRKIHLPLNGQNSERTIHLVEEILRLCPTVHLNVGLSLDGIGETHDKQRGVNGSFLKVMATHEELFKLSKRYANLTRGFVTTVTEINVKKIEELMKYVFNLPSGPDYHDVMVCRVQADSKTGKELLIKPDEYNDVLKVTNQYALFYAKQRYGGFVLGILGNIRHRMLNYIYMNAYRGRRIIACKAPELLRVIEADGRVRMCELFKEVGNIKDYNYDLRKMDEVFDLPSQKPKCACTHPCFIVPSLRYLPNILQCCASIVMDSLNLWKK